MKEETEMNHDVVRDSEDFETRVERAVMSRWVSREAAARVAREEAEVESPQVREQQTELLMGWVDATADEQTPGVYSEERMAELVRTAQTGVEVYPDMLRVPLADQEINGVRRDDVGLFYRGKTNMAVSRRAAGKTWLAILTVIDTLEAEFDDLETHPSGPAGRVLYLDFEDKFSTFYSRFVTLGREDLLVRAVREGRFVWMSPGTLPMRRIEEMAQWWSTFDLVVVDVLNRLLVEMGSSPDSANLSMMRLSRSLFSRATGMDRKPAILVLDHPSKANQDRIANHERIPKPTDFAPGGGAARTNNADGHVVGLWPRVPFSRKNREGRFTLVTIKDRVGYYTEEDIVAHVDTVEAHRDDAGDLRMQMVAHSEEEDRKATLEAEHAAARRMVLRMMRPLPGGSQWRPVRFERVLAEARRSQMDEMVVEITLGMMVSEGLVAIRDGMYVIADVVSAERSMGGRD
jgi:hypothetical protein